MRRLAGTFTVIALILAAMTMSLAQNPNIVTHRPYNRLTELVLRGSINQLERNPKNTPLLGTYLILATPNGKVPVHLGFFRLTDGRLAIGDTVTVIGTLASVNGKNLVLARIVNKGSEMIAVRNENGIALRMARQ
jgi:hypothetical protein